MEYKNSEEILYVLEVFGHAPEFWPAIAFRKSGSNGNQPPAEPERRKEIKCPYCGKQFMVVSAKRKLDLLRYPERMKTPCHEYRKCRICHEQIGVRYRAESISA